VAITIAPLKISLSPATAKTRLTFLAATNLLVIANVGHAHPERYSEIDLHAWGLEDIARRGVAVTTRDEYASRWMPARLPFRPERIRVIDGDAEIEKLSRTPSRWRAQVKASGTYPSCPWPLPGWRRGCREGALFERGTDRPHPPSRPRGALSPFTRTWWRVAADGRSPLGDRA
jgi:hypothetical protein